MLSGYSTEPNTSLRYAGETSFATGNFGIKFQLYPLAAE